LATPTTPKKTTTRRPAAASKPKAEPAPEPEEVLEAEVVDEPDVDPADEMTPSERAEAIAARDEMIAELLDGLPALREPHEFRHRHRAEFERLQLFAMDSGAFDGDGSLTFDTRKAEERKRYDAYLEFISRVDEWAESIAVDPAAYTEWSQGLDSEPFMALFMKYRDALGESRRSAS
jgi:hypothetical protein